MTLTGSIVDWSRRFVFADVVVVFVVVAFVVVVVLLCCCCSCFKALHH